MRSKAGLFDESVLCDSLYLRWASDFFTVLTTTRPATESLWPFNHSHLVRSFQLVADACHVKDACLYQLRHGGASEDTLSARRNLLEVQERGRWSSHASVLRYRKAGRAQQEIHKMHPLLRAFGTTALKATEECFRDPAVAADVFISSFGRAALEDLRARVSRSKARCARTVPQPPGGRP